MEFLRLLKIKVSPNPSFDALIAAAALIAALFATGFIFAREGYSGTETLGAKINITASVLKHASMEVLNQIPELVITPADIMRGYVEVGRGTRIKVRNNHRAGYLVVFENPDEQSPFFRSVQVLVGGKSVQVPLNGGWIHQPDIRGGSILDISYRFVLSKEAKSGAYKWPLIVSVRSM